MEGQKLQTHSCILLMLCVLFGFCSVSDPSFASAPRNVDAGSDLNKIDLRLVPDKKIYSQGGPVACHLIILNGSTHDIICDLNLPVPMGLYFKTRNDQGILPPSREFPYQVSTMASFLTLKAGSSFDVPIYLNRFFIFDKPGDYALSYLFFLDFYEAKADGKIVAIDPTHKNEGVVWSGTVKIAVHQADTSVLTKELAAESRKLVSPDVAKRLEATEALNFLDTPLALPYLKAILTMPKAREFPGAELDTVKALSRIGTPEALALLESTLPNLDGSAVGEALKVVLAKNIVLSDDTIKLLLSSFDPQERYTTINYLAKAGDSHDIPLVEPLRKDINLSVVKAANECIATLKDKVDYSLSVKADIWPKTSRCRSLLTRFL